MYYKTFFLLIFRKNLSNDHNDNFNHRDHEGGIIGYKINIKYLNTVKNNRNSIKLSKLNKERTKKKGNALTANRTRGQRMATVDFTTKLLAL